MSQQMKCVVGMLLATAMGGGCAWQDAVAGLSEVPGSMRVADQNAVKLNTRWRLPNNTSILLRSKGEVDPAFEQAAIEGLRTWFSNVSVEKTSHLVLTGLSTPAGGSSQYMKKYAYILEVDWEQLGSAVRKRPSFKVKYLPAIGLPQLPFKKEFTITLQSVDEALYAPINMKLKPALWKHFDTAACAALFDELGAMLRQG